MADEPTYTDDHFVYVDPRNRTVLGTVEWKSEGIAVPMELPELEEKGEKKRPDDRPRRKPKKRYAPWGSYRSMKRMYRLEGKQDDSGQGEFNDVVARFEVDPMSV